MITTNLPTWGPAVIWAPEQTLGVCEAEVHQWIGTDGVNLFDISLQINPYEDEPGVVQLSLSWASTGPGDDPAWHTIYYRNWQRQDLASAVELARTIVDEAIARTHTFFQRFAGTDTAEVS